MTEEEEHLYYDILLYNLTWMYFDGYCIIAAIKPYQTLNIYKRIVPIFLIPIFKNKYIVQMNLNW